VAPNQETAPESILTGLFNAGRIHAGAGAQKTLSDEAGPKDLGKSAGTWPDYFTPREEGRQMKRNEAIALICAELDRAQSLHPTFPVDTVHQVAVMVEEAGEAMQAALNHVYHGGPLGAVKTETIHSGAMALRVLMNLGV